MQSLTRMASLAKPNLSRALLMPSHATRSIARPLVSFSAQQQAQQSQNVRSGEQQQQPGASGAAVTTGKRGGHAVARRPHRGSALVAPVVMGDLAPFPSFGRLGSFLRDIEDEMESMLSLFGTPGDRPARQGAALAPAARVPTIPVDIREDDKAIYVTADAPGLGKGDIKVTIDKDHTLTIEGERKQEHEEDDEGVRRIERSYGVFVRRFQLPDNVDPNQVDAKLENGQLRIVVLKTGKKEEEPAHTVEIK